jgi:hypothetical protein
LNIKHEEKAMVQSNKVKNGILLIINAANDLETLNPIHISELKVNQIFWEG